jgi:N12 class adenine-specific DNA methylase
MAQPPKTGGYAPVLPSDTQVGLNQDSIDQYKLDLEDADAINRRQKALDKYLSQYEDDPLTKAFATINFEAREAEQRKESQKLAQEKERKAFINKYPDDPIMQAWAQSEHDAEKTKNLPQKEAFARRERLEQIDERDRVARKLERLGGGNAFLRETLGSAVNVVPGLAAIPARAAESVGMVEPGTTNELNRQSGAFQDAREQAREDDMSPWLSRMYGGASQSLLQTAATPGGAASKIAGAGVMSGNEALTTAEDAGLTGMDRLRYAGSQAIFEAGIAALGQKIFGPGVESRLAGQQIAAETWKQLGKNVGTDALKEMPEEVVTTILQDLSSKYEGISPDLTLGDFVANSVDAAVQSAMMAGMGNAPNAGKLVFDKKPETNAEKEANTRFPWLRDRQSQDPSTQAAEKLPPAVQAFTEKPSATNYEAAVKAGLPPIERPNREGRAKYAEDVRARVTADPAPSNNAPLEPAAPMEAPSGTVPDELFDEAFNYWRGESNGQETNVVPGTEGNQGSGEEGAQGQEGRQEGLLKQPAVTQEGAPPADAQKQPAAHTRESFEKEYRDTFKEWQKYPPDQAGHQVYTEKMADLYDAHPDWADEIERTTPSPVPEPGVVSPDQSSPPTAGPVSSEPRTAIAKAITEAATGIPPEDDDGWITLPKPIKALAGREGKDPLPIEVKHYNPKTGEVSAWNPTTRGSYSDMKLDELVDPEPSATEYDRLYKELQPLYRDPKHKVGDREHMARIRDLEQQVDFHKPAAVARAQAEIDAEAAKSPITPEAYAKLPMFDVYPLQRKDGSKFAVKQSEKGGFGDALFDTEAAAKEYATTERQRVEDRSAELKKLQDKEEADQKKQLEHEASFQGFLTDDPKTKGRRLKTLDSSLNYKNKPTTRKALVERKVSDGWIVNDKEQLQAPTGEFLDDRDLTKTGIDYARHLIQQKEAPAGEQKSPAKTPVPAFAALPQKSQDLFNKAFESDDVESLKQMVDKNNIAWNAEWESRTGNKLPKSLKARHQAVLDWVGAQATAPTVESPANAETSENKAEESPVDERAALREQLRAAMTAAAEAAKPKTSETPAKPEPTSSVEFTELSKGINAPGVLRTFRAVAGDRVLVMEYSKKLSQWSIMESRANTGTTKGKTPSKGTVLAYGMEDLKKAKDVAERIVAGTFDREADEWFWKSDPINTGFTNAQFGADIKSSASMKDRLAAVLRSQNLATNGHVLVKVSDSDRDAILKAIGPTSPAFEMKSPAQMMADAQEWIGKSKVPLTIAGYRGGDITTKSVAFRDPNGEIYIANKAYHDTVLKRHPDATVSVTEEGRLVYDNNGDVVAIMMPLEIRGDDTHVNLMKKGDYPFRDRPETPATKPSAPKARKTSTAPAIANAKPKSPAKTVAEQKAEEARERREAAAEAIRKKLQEMKRQPFLLFMPPVDTELVKLVAEYAIASIDVGIKTFREFVIDFRETFGAKNAQDLSVAVEEAWNLLPLFGHDVPPASNGEAKTILEGLDGQQPERDESAGDGGSETAGLPVGERGMEETPPEVVSADDGGGDSGRSGTAGGGRPEGEAPGTAELENEGTGSVSDGTAGDDRSAGRSGRLDYRITGADRIGEKFHPKERFDKNVEAIKVLKQIEAENRRATLEEQKVLAQYVGWGGLKEAFSTRDDQGLREKAILKELLTERELAEARTSVRNAHYTSPEVISAMWEGLTDAGFAGGRILEPSSGIGHFYGLIPESVAEVSKLSGIEMDGLTARIAQQLYQTADITHSPYQDVNVKNLQDLVISNVPFGPYKAKDKYNKALKKKSSIHNFFFLKAMTNVRPGGVIAFITSRYTMDGRTAEHMEVRETIAAAGGRFVGAVRLPNDAFMGIAKTKVTTDVIFIQKDAGDAQPWRNTKENAGGFIFNEYFHDHPENVLGKIDAKGGTQIGEWGIAPDGHDIGKELAQKIAAMPFDRAAMAENSTEAADTVEDTSEDADVPDGRLAIRGGKLFKAVGGKLEEVPLWGGERGQERKFAIIRKMGNLAAVRDRLSDLETSPLATDAEIERARKLLNREYDKFVQEHGFVHKQENQGLFRPDEQLPTLLALEEWDTDTKTAKKADVFEKRVQRPDSNATTPTTAEGAAVESYARLGRIDIPLISEWLGKSESQVEQEMTGWAYKDPATGEWSLKNVYLSGNIAKKLKDAEEAAKHKPEYQKNADDLRRVLPPRKTAGQIHVRPRSPFITPGQYHQFMRHMGVNGDVRHDDISGAWLIDNPHIEDPVKAGPWSVGKKTAADLIYGLLNNKPPVVWTKDYNGNPMVDEAATQLARAKAKEIEEEFGKWIFSDPERAKQIEDSFNDTVGAFIEGEWDGSHLTLPGMNVNISLLPHQLNAIWRAIVTGNTLLAHEVGLGKTFIMAAIAMERKRLGLVTNQMFVVPNHLLSQWASEFKALYPSAKLLALESDQINSKNRRTLMERVKSGRFDAIIVTPEAYKKMPMSNEIVEAKLNEITQKIENTIKEAKKAKGDNKNFVAKLESVLEAIRGKMEVMLNDPAKDAGAKFDELGIDAIYVDEAHEYRNLWSMTQMGDISGVGLDGNQKTFDMLLKTDYLNAKTNNRGIVFATGTPIANSISELYSMQRYLQPQTLAEAGVASFDDWANTFGEAVTDIEVDPTGSGFRSKTRFKEFRNTIALSKIFRQVADVKYAEDVGLDKVRPTLRGGKLHAIQIMPSLGLLDYVRNLVRRLEISKKRSFDKRIDNPLKVTTDGRKAALDMRLVVPEEDGISSKINHAVENVARIHREESERKGAQLLWVNLGTPASAKKRKAPASTHDPDADPTAVKMDSDEASLESGRINAYEDIKRKLIAQGIPESEIAFIHDHDDKDRKRALFQKVRDGKVRILISTVKKLATGANIQTRLAAMHFLDPPWKPADIEQALGRAIRRGNLYKDWGGVQAFTYVTRGSFDAYIWQLLENKAKAIKQIMRGESDSVEDTGRIELNADEVKALASSNPKVLELVKVRNEVGQLRAEYHGYMSERGNVQSQIAQYTGMIKNSVQYVANAEAELKKMPSRDDLHSNFSVKIGNKEYSKRSEIGAALIEAMPEVDSKDEDKRKAQIRALAEQPVAIGSAYGKTISAGRGFYDEKARVIIGGDYFTLSDDNTGNGVKLFNYFDKKYDEPRRLKEEMVKAEQELAALKGRADQTWPKSERLKENEEALQRLEAELGAAAGDKNVLPVVSALTKFAIMAEKLGRKEGRPVTFDGTQWIHGDRLPVNTESITTEMELEVDREVALLLSDSKEAPHESFFFHRSKESQAADKARQELRKFQLLNTHYNKVIGDEWKRITQASTPWTGLPISDEMARAIVGRMVGSIRVGVKRFEVFIRDLRADFAEDLVIGLKPTFIRTWNALKDKYDLYEATEAGFDTAMSDTKDVDIEQAVEAAKGEPAIADSAAGESQIDAPRVFSTQNASTDQTREQLGMPERPTREKASRPAQNEMAVAVAKTEAGRKDIDDLIRELTLRPRTLSVWDNDRLGVRRVELQNKLKSALRNKVAAAKAGDDVQVSVNDTAIAEYRPQLAAVVKILSEDASYLSGSQLQARKAWINEDFTLENHVLEFSAAMGREPNTEELLAMDERVKAIEDSNARLEQLLAESEAKNEDLQGRLKAAHDVLVNGPAPQKPETPKAPPVEKPESSARKAALAEIADGVKMFRDMLKPGIPFSALGALDPFLKIASGYSKLGVITLKEFLTRAVRSLGPEAKNYISEMTAAWKQVRGAAGQADISSVTDTIDPMDPDTIGRAARNLHGFVIERDGLDASPEGRNAAVVAVHEILIDFVPELTIDQTARAMSGIGIYSPLSDNEIEAIRRDQRAQLLLLEQISDWKKGQAPPATGQERSPVSDEQRALRKAVNEAKKAAGIVTATEGQLRSALDAAKRMAKNRISDLTKAIESGQRIARSRKLLTPDAELTALQAERDALQKLYDEAFGKNELSDEQRLNRAEKALDRAISGLESDLKAGKLYPDAPKPQLTSPAIEAKQAALDALRASREELRLSSGEAQQRSDAAYERLLRARNAELARRLAEKDFAPAPKKPERQLTPEMLKEGLKNSKLKQEYQKEQIAWVFSQRHPIYKAWKKGPVMVGGMIRKGLTTIDQSLIGRQGWLLGITHPIIYGKAARKAFASNPLEARSMFPTEQDLFNTEAELDADASWVRLEKLGKLAVTGIHGGMQKTEENMQDVPEWFDKIWGIGGSERAGSAFINTQRRLVFRELVQQLAVKQDLSQPASVSNADLRLIANLVNVGSGRGNLGEWETALNVMTFTFFSPRWWASRLQTLTGQPLWHNARWTGGEGASTEARLIVAKEWAKQFAAQAGIMALAIGGLTLAFGDPGEDEEWDWYGDPQSPDFGKIRLGSTPIDMTSGLGQHVSLLARMVTGKQVNRWDEEDVNRWRMFVNYGRGKLAPTPGLVADWMAGQSIGQDEFGSAEWVKGKITPLSIQDVVKTFKEESIPLGVVVSTMMFFGMGAQTREAKVKARKDMVNELRAMKKQGKPEKIQAALAKHLEYTAKLEAKEKLRTADPEDAAKLEKVVAGETSPELSEAIQKEKYDITLSAIEMLSTEDPRKKKAPQGDQSITNARTLLRTLAPTYEEANALFTEAYKERNGSLTELVGPEGEKRYVVKKSVLGARRRLRAMYRAD